MTVAVVTPWLNHIELEGDYMEAMADRPPDELLIVDNGSEPPLRFSEIRLDENVGYTRACNIGLEAATTDVVVFLNNDVAIASDGWLNHLVGFVEPQILVGPLRFDVHGNVGGTQVPYIDGWCLAGMRDDLLELGGFDETFVEPAYYSDNDLCLRARAAGMRLRGVRPGLYHKGSATAGKTSPAVSAASLANRETYMRRAEEMLA